MDRRTFLIRTSGTIVVVSMPMLSSLAACVPKAPDAGAGLSRQQWQALAAVQDHLFPSQPGAPGAKDINATGYLRFVLADPKLDPADRDLIKEGVVQLEGIAQEMEGKRFIALSPAQREAALRRFEATSTGHRWLAEMLGYIFEALLGDPVYGGNPNGIGWKWLSHNPGFPLPPANKRYYLLI